MPSGHIELIKLRCELPTRSTVYILQPCLWDFHCSSFKDMGLQIPLIPTGRLPTRKLGISHYSLLFPALGSECQDFFLSRFKVSLNSTSFNPYGLLRNSSTTSESADEIM